ncbi:MAG: arabinose efflux permease, partial [Cyanobacteria bacterium P01_G01_bin.49]
MAVSDSETTKNTTRTSTDAPPTDKFMDRQTSPKNSPRQGFAPVLENPRFLVLWVGQIFSQLADKIYLVLMIA